jgi:hypothetical protein
MRISYGSQSKQWFFPKQHYPVWDLLRRCDVFPVRYELNLHIVSRINSVFKGLKIRIRSHGKNCIHLTRNRLEWRAVLNTVMNLRVPQEGWCILTRWTSTTPISERRTVLRVGYICVLPTLLKIEHTVAYVMFVPINVSLCHLKCSRRSSHFEGLWIHLILFTHRKTVQNGKYLISFLM